MTLSPVPPLLVALGLLLVPFAAAEEPDKDTLQGMDAEVRRDWLEAAQAFARAAAAVPGDARRSQRLRLARQRGVALWKPQIEQMLKEKRFDDAARAVMVVSLIDPGNTAFGYVRGKVAQAGVQVPDPPGEETPSPLFPRRSAMGRVHAWASYGAPFGRASRIIDAGVGYLIQTQGEKGNWNCKKYGGYESNDLGVTALALLALLVDGPGGLSRDHGPAARRAADYIAQRLSDKNEKEIYATVFATEALAEYAAIARDTERLRPALEHARNLILAAQNPGAGWQYRPRDGKSDTSVTARAVSALERLQRVGLPVPRESMQGAMQWIDSMVEPNFGQIGYNYKGGASARLEKQATAFPPDKTHAMTAAGALVTTYAHADRDWLPMSFALLAEVPPTSAFPDMYYWEIGSRVHVAATGAVPLRWYEALVAAAATCARSDGSVADCDAWQGEGGTIYATSMTILALAAPFSEPAPKAESASDFLREGTRDVVVVGNAAETPSGIYVDGGTVFTVSVSGAIQPWDDSPLASSDGFKPDVKGQKPILKGAPFGCLLGRIGPEGKLFRIQATKPVTPDSCGQLFLLSNDERPEDNSGDWTVRVMLVK